MWGNGTGDPGVDYCVFRLSRNGFPCRARWSLTSSHFWRIMGIQELFRDYQRRDVQHQVQSADKKDPDIHYQAKKRNYSRIV
jgi:hypothetical protein